MAQSKEVTSFSSAISPSFTTDLMPAAERTALLFQLCYLYLAGYPELEQLIRERAVNTRLLFVSSERVMFKCLCTSDNLVKSLFPILKVAVQKNKTEIAKTYLQKAQGWITEIIEAAEEMVEGYKKENVALSNTTTTIYKKKEEKERTSNQMRDIDRRIEEFKSQMQTIKNDMNTKQQHINQATSKRDSHISYMASCDKEFAARRKFTFGWWISWSSGPSDSDVAQTHNSNRQILKQLHDGVQRHMADMDGLKRREQNLQNDMMSKKMERMDIELRHGSIPSPEHLEEVKHCLVRIQDVLMLILRFWNHVAEMLKKLEKDTFIGRDLMDDLEDFKEIFVDSITEAEKAWQAFGQSCMKSQEVFDVQSKEGYTFLEINPSTLSDADKRKQICDVNERLKEIGQDAAQPELPATGGTE
ncbi:uncharacterized protein LOC134443913 [Engraulis encrasicolus]|uniref:uncharacterized protein LOC134443913 n=1 Tax=Engraulis encrasicolus TaxID=184585 RepID=UPI002FD540D7